MNQSDSLDTQIRTLWADMGAWLSSHSLQIILGFAAGAVIVAAMLGLKWLALRLCRGDRDAAHWRTVFGRVLAQTRLWFMIAVAARLVAGYAQPPEAVAITLATLFIIAATLQVALWARELVLGVIEHRAGGLEANSGLGSAIGIIRLLVTIAIFSSPLSSCSTISASTSPASSPASASAASPSASPPRAFSTTSSRRCRSSSTSRSAAAIRSAGTRPRARSSRSGSRSTRVRSLTGEEVVISNTNLLGKELHNMARLNRRRIVQPFGLVYQTAPEVCARIPEIVKDVVNSCEKCTFLRCGMVGYGASSLDFEFQFDVKSEVWQKVFDARSQVLIALLARFNAEGIEFAYPTQTSFTAAPDGTLIMPYPDSEKPAESSPSR